MPKLSEEQIVAKLREDIDAAEAVNDLEARANADWYKYYRAKKMGNEAEGRSKIVDSTVFETVEWVLPSLIDVYSPENGIPQFEGHGPEDVTAAQKMTELVQFQFWRQNEGDQILQDAIKDALLYKPGGIIKYCWETVPRIEKTRYAGLSQQEMMMLSQMPNVTISGIEPTEGGYGATVERRLTEYDGPRLYVLPPWEFLRHPNARNVRESHFCAHRKRVTADFLTRMGETGYYKNVEKAIGEAQAGRGASSYEEDSNLAQDQRQREDEPSSDKARQEIILYECYASIDTDGDGMLENRVITLVGSTIIRNTKNHYERPPFVILRPINDPHKFSGISLAEMVEDLQKLRTFLIRQMVDNMAQANNSRKVFDPSRVNMADVLNNIPGGAIRTVAGVNPRDAILEFPVAPLNPVTFSVLEYVTSLNEQRIGTVKAVKGVGDQYNVTATGQMNLINQASSRIRLMAKTIGIGLSELFRAFVLMNKKFLTQTTYIRLADNQFMEIRPDDLEGRFDLNLNVYMGASSRQEVRINMQQLLAVLGQLQMNTGVQTLDANNVKNIISEIVRSMGYKDLSRFIPLILQQPPAQANTGMLMNEAMRQQMFGEAEPQMPMIGGANVGSTANAGQGGAGTTNPTGAGMQIPAFQAGAGGFSPTP